MLELRWCYTLIIFAGSFICSWVLFAALYTIEPAARGQLRSNYTGKMCIYNGASFVDMIMFSVETQVTIGYGSRFEEFHLLLLFF